MESLLSNHSFHIPHIFPNFLSFTVLEITFNFICVVILYFLLAFLVFLLYIQIKREKNKVWVFKLPLYLACPFLHLLPHLLPKCLSALKISHPLDTFKDLAHVRTFTGHKNWYSRAVSTCSYLNHTLFLPTTQITINLGTWNHVWKLILKMVVTICKELGSLTFQNCLISLGLLTFKLLKVF